MVILTIFKNRIMYILKVKLDIRLEWVIIYKMHILWDRKILIIITGNFK